MAVSAPPFLTDCGVVFAELEEVAEDGCCAGYLRQAFDVRDVGGNCDLFISARANDTVHFVRGLLTW